MGRRILWTELNFRGTHQAEPGLLENAHQQQHVSEPSQRVVFAENQTSNKQPTNVPTVQSPSEYIAQVGLFSKKLVVVYTRLTYLGTIVQQTTRQWYGQSLDGEVSDRFRGSEC